MAKGFGALHNDSVARPSAYVVRQNFICREICRIILRRFLGMKVK